MLFNHWLENEKLVGLFIVLMHQVEAWGEESIDLHNFLKKITVQLIFQLISFLLNPQILSLQLFVNLNWQALYFIFQANDTFI